MNYTSKNHGNVAVPEVTTTLHIKHKTLKNLHTFHYQKMDQYTHNITLIHVVDYAAKSEARGIFHNGQTSVSLQITLNKLSFLQTRTPIKTDNSAAEGILTATVIQTRSNAMDMRFHWMK